MVKGVKLADFFLFHKIINIFENNEQFWVASGASFIYKSNVIIIMTILGTVWKILNSQSKDMSDTAVCEYIKATLFCLDTKTVVDR